MNRRGFSTIEMIVVMLLGMSILAMAIPTLASEIRRLRAHESHAELNQSASSVRTLLRHDLNRAGYLVPDSVNPLVVSGDTLTLRFEAAEVRYYMNGNGLHRWQNGSGHLVAQSVRSFDVSVSGRRVQIVVEIANGHKGRVYNWLVSPRNLLY